MLIELGNVNCKLLILILCTFTSIASQYIDSGGVLYYLFIEFISYLPAFIIYRIRLCRTPQENKLEISFGVNKNNAFNQIDQEKRKKKKF